MLPSLKIGFQEVLKQKRDKGCKDEIVNAKT